MGGEEFDDERDILLKMWWLLLPSSGGCVRLMGMRLTLFGLLLTLTFSPAALAVPVSAVPDVRPRSAVADLTETLSSPVIQEINAEAQRALAGGELYVAVIDTTGGEPSRPYATRLFNQLGLDKSARNRGVLLMAALTDRKAEIILGDGYRPSVSNETDWIMQNVVIARFRSGDIPGGLVQGARALVDRVLLPSVETEPPGLWVRVKDTVGGNPFPLWGGLGCTGLLALVAGRRYRRHRSRKCNHCHQPMVRLGEVEDDAYLSTSEHKEELLGSVDYDVWICTRCDYRLKLRYEALFSAYSKCPQCNAETLETKTTTLSHPTEYSTGLASVDKACKHCGHHNSYTQIIPCVTPSSDSYSSYSSSSSGGGSSSGNGSSGSW